MHIYIFGKVQEIMWITLRGHFESVVKTTNLLYLLKASGKIEQVTILNSFIFNYFIQVFDN
jgi:hypothetical protein